MQAPDSAAQQLARDAWTLVQQAPQSTHAWHRLFGYAQGLDANSRAAVAAAAGRVRYPDDWSRFLAATFAHGLTREGAALADAADVFLNSRLPSECGLALMNTVQAQALKACTTTRDMQQLFEQARLPAVSHAIGQRLLAGQPAKQSEPSANPARSAVVVTPSLSYLRQHAPTQMAVLHARQLLRMGWQVSMIAAQEFAPLQMESWLGAPRAMVLGAPRPAELDALRQEMPVYLAPAAYSMDVRWRTVVSKVRELQPQAVLFVGVCSPLLDVLNREFAVVAMATNAGMLAAGPHDVALVGGGATILPWAGVQPPVQQVVHTRRFTVDMAAAPRPRHAIGAGLPEDAVVWMSSGTRLHEEMRGPWTARVLQTLEQNPGVHWMIVGLGAEQQRALNITHPRVHFVPYDADLPSLVAATDIYLAPLRLGGGASVCMAMAHGVAVVAPASGDTADKLGEAAPADEDACFAALVRYTQAPAERAAWGQQLRERFHAVFAAQETDTVVGDALQLAQASAAQRMGRVQAL